MNSLEHARPLWAYPWTIQWLALVLDSHRNLMNHQLIPRQSSSALDAELLFTAPFVLVSHGRGEDPILNYGNLKELELWELDWQKFVLMPSRLTAQPVAQEKRAEMLARWPQMASSKTTTAFESRPVASGLKSSMARSGTC